MSANKVTKITMIVDAAQGKAEVAGLNSELAGNVTAFQASATSAASANASLQQLLLTKNRLMVETSAVGASIKAENAELARLQGLAAASATGQKQFGSAIAESEQKLLALLVTQRELAVSTAENNAALKSSSATTLQKAASDQAAAAAAAEHAAAQALLGAESDVSAGKIIKTGLAIDKLSGVAIPGGKAIGTLVGSMSALSIAQLGLIAAGALLIGYLIEQLRHKRELVAVSEEQLKLDIASRATMEGQQNLQKDLTALLLHYRDTKQAVREASKKETEGYYEVRNSQISLFDTTRLVLEQQILGLTRQKDVQTAITNTGEAYQKEREERGKSAEQLKAVEKQLFEFARQTDRSTASVLAAARAAGLYGQDLVDLSVKLTAAEFAQRHLNEAVDKAKAPQVDYSKTKPAVLGLQSAVESGMSEAAAAGLGRNDQLRANAKSLGELSAAVKNHTVAQSDLTPKMAANVKQFEALTEKHHSAAGGAKAYANALIDLKARAEDAEAALKGDTFGLREERIATAMQRERDHLEINKRDKTTALDALTQIERAQIAKVALDRTAAEQAVMVEIARMHIEAGDNEIAKRRQLLDLDVALRSQALRKDFGDTTQTADLIALYKRAKEEQFEKWYLDLWSKADAQRLAAEMQMMDTLAEERLKRDKATLDRAVRLSKDIAAATSAVGGSRFQPANSAETAYILRLMSQLGPQFKEVAKDANLVKNAFSEVDRMFGFVGRDARTLSLQLRALTAYGNGDTFSGLRLSLKALGSEMISSGVLATNMAQSLFDAFSSSLTQGGNFVRALGANLVGGITAVVGQMLLQNGILLIGDGIKNVLIANGLNALFPGAGAALLAAGHAEIIQGIIFGAAGGVVAGGGAAIAGVIRGNGNQSSAAGSAAGAGAGASGGVSAATPTNASRQSGPTVINVAGASHSASVDSYHAWLERAFGDRRDLAVQRSNREAVMQREQMQQESGPVTIVVQLGESGAEKFLTKLMDGQGRLTLEGAIGKDKRRLRAALVGN